MTKRIVVISDTQIPYHDARALRAVVRFIGDFQPDEVIHIGDLMDYPTPSRWSKGSAEEFALQMQRDNAVAARFLDSLQDVFDGPIGIHEGNHDERPRTYLTKYAPALAEYYGHFRIDALLNFKVRGITLLPDFYEVAPGWLTTHGHVGKISLSQIAGSTAKGAAAKFGKSVVMGHTHRLGLTPHTTGYAGKIYNQVFGMEVGHLMDPRKAAYLKGGTGNWQLGFGLLTVDGRHVHPEIVPIYDNKFVVDGTTWRVK